MKLFFSVGEPSGDQHAAHLIQELRLRDPSLTIEGYGGPEMMRLPGVQLLYDLTQMAVMGFLRVIPLLARFRRLVKNAEKHLDRSRPDAVVLVDFPGFNWWIARAAKKRGIPVYYYLPPQLWAWAPWRIRRVRRWVDKVICTLPFEFDWYKKRGVEAVWVGHPFFDEVASYKLDANLVSELRSDSSRKTIAILPGSRDHEVDRNYPLMLEVIRRVSAAIPGIRWVVGNYRSHHTEVCRQLQAQAKSEDDITYFVDRTSEVIEAADCCLMVSGSISLELLARHTPGIVLYRAGRLGRFAARLLMTCRYITLTNLIAGRELMPEFISCGRPDRDVSGMSEQLIQWCRDERSLAELTANMAQLAASAAITGATQRTAELLVTELQAAPVDSESKAA